jgi:hypothetical protein
MQSIFEVIVTDPISKYINEVEPGCMKARQAGPL